MPWWRPEPLWPTPPKGSEGSAPWTAAELTQAPPEVVRRSTSSATASSFANTYSASGRSPALTWPIASSSVS